MKDLQERIALFEEVVVPRWSAKFHGIFFRGMDLPRSASVLCVLSGYGEEVLKLLKEHGESVERVLGVDPDRDAVEVAAHRVGSAVGGKAFFKKEKIDRLSFPEGSFDMVMGNLGLMDSRTNKALVKEMVRVTKPGGTVRLGFVARNSLLELFHAMMTTAQRMDMAAEAARISEAMDALPSARALEYTLQKAGTGGTEVLSSKFEIEYDAGQDFVECPVYAMYIQPFIAGFVGDTKALREIEVNTAEKIEKLARLGGFKTWVTAALAAGTKEEGR